MKLVIFDIDGTILDSVSADDECFIQAFKDLHQIDLTNADWNNFKHVTDAGLTIEIFERYFQRTPSDLEVNTLKIHFCNLLKQRVDEFTEIKNALAFIRLLSYESDLEIGFATGGWRASAEMKCKAIGLDLNEFIVKSSNDHFSRTRIIELVTTEALDKNRIRQFDSITYFGDGLWDLRATQELGIEFVGVDFCNSDKLRTAGVERIIKNYAEPSPIRKWINEKLTGNTVPPLAGQ